MMEIMTGFIIMFILIIIASYLKYRIYEKEDERKMEQEIQDKILGTKDKQKIIEMSEQEIVDRAKEYWKQKLMDAYNEVDKLEV